MSTWNLVKDYGAGEIVDTVEGPFAKAQKRARVLKKELDEQIVIYQSLS